MLDLHFDTDQILHILAALPVIFFAITVHELSHAWMAVKCGDPTPEQQGRITLNPFAHFDPVGTLFILITVISGFGIGWGKPVMIDPRNFRNPRWNEFWVAAAGPISNLIQATVFTLFGPVALLVFHLTGLVEDAVLFQFLQYFIFSGVIINLALAFFNLIPLFPLDGEKILVQSLPLYYARRYVQLRPYGFQIVIGLLIIGWITDGLINPIMWWIRGLMTPFLWILLPISDWIAELLFRMFS